MPRYLVGVNAESIGSYEPISSTNLSQNNFFHLQTKTIRDLQTLNSYITLVRGVKSCMAVIMFETFSPFDNVLATTIGNGIDFEANPGL